MATALAVLLGLCLLLPLAVVRLSAQTVQSTETIREPGPRSDQTTPTYKSGAGGPKQAKPDRKSQITGTIYDPTRRVLSFLRARVAS